jgi:hypothetical protein
MRTRQRAKLLEPASIGPGDLPVVFGGANVLRRTTAGVLADYVGLTIANFQTERLTWCEDELDTLEKITRKIRDVNRPPSGPGL